MSSFYKHYGILPSPREPQDQLQNLFERQKRRPKRFVARYDSATEPNAIHQMDLLELPRDPSGAHYCLVVVDLATRHVALRALKAKAARNVSAALQDIYDTDPDMSQPQRMEVDAGTEFKGAVAEYLRESGTMIRVGEPGRHQQQGLAEHINGLIGRAIMIRQAGQELLTNKGSKEWVSDLPEIEKALNERLERDPPEQEAEYIPPANQEDGDILPEGTLVRRKLDRPQDVLGNVLSPGGGATHRRAGDPTYETKPRKIETIIFKPGMSVRYLLEGLPNVSYGRYELQVVPEGEQPPPPTVLRGKAAAAALKVDEITGREKEGRSVFYDVQMSDGTVGRYRRVDLMKERGGKQLVLDYERALKQS